jgi:transposase-like protein
MNEQVCGLCGSRKIERLGQVAACEPLYECMECGAEFYDEDEDWISGPTPTPEE